MRVEKKQDPNMELRLLRDKTGGVMSRRGVAKKRTIVPDYKYRSELVTRLINNVMLKGKKTVAEKIVYDSLDIIKERTKKDPIEVFTKALENVRPLLEVRSRRVGGATYQIPIEVRYYRAESLSFRWIINFAKQRKEKGMASKLAGEILDAANKIGASVKKRENVHKMAEANKAFAHYRW